MTSTHGNFHTYELAVVKLNARGLRLPLLALAPDGVAVHGPTLVGYGAAHLVDGLVGPADVQALSRVLVEYGLVRALHVGAPPDPRAEVLANDVGRVGRILRVGQRALLSVMHMFQGNDVK